MPNWRRAHVPGGSYFFTVVTDNRTPLFASPNARSILGSILRRCLLQRPFTLNAIVLLPDHLHAIWSLPPGDDALSSSGELAEPGEPLTEPHLLCTLGPSPSSQAEHVRPSPRRANIPAVARAQRQRKTINSSTATEDAIQTVATVPRA